MKEQVIGFGFNPEDSAHHLLVTVSAGNRQKVRVGGEFAVMRAMVSETDRDNAVSMRRKGA